MIDRIFKYVANARVLEYLDRGWILPPVAGVTFHDLYSAIMEWPGPEEPPDMAVTKEIAEREMAAERRHGVYTMPDGSRECPGTGEKWPAPAPAHFPYARYDALVEETFAEIKKLGTIKGGEYAGDDDRLANFRRNGLALGLPMEAIWHTYMAKHYDAVTQFIKDLIHDKTRKRLEPLSGRLDDIIVYCLLFKAMLIEREEAAAK